MRKFTKEIASLLATVTVSLSANAGSAASEEVWKMTGQATDPDYIDELAPTAGVAMLPDDDLPVTTTTTKIGLIGTTTAKLETTTTVPSMVGTTVAPAKITTTAAPTMTPMMIGTTITTKETTETTTTEEFPPLMGLIGPADGDANCDGDLDMSDAVLVMQSFANPNKYGIDGTAENHLTVMGEYNADMNGDGLTVGDALAIQKKLLGMDYYK